MASGVVQRLVRSGFRVCITEIPEPLAVRREVSFCEAVFAGRMEVEGLVEAGIRKKGFGAWEEGEVPVIIDPECAIRKILSPDVVVDAILAKKKHRHKPRRCPPGHRSGSRVSAGRDVHVVIETNRGHHLGRVIEGGGRAGYGHPRRYRRLYGGKGPAGPGRRKVSGKEANRRPGREGGGRGGGGRRPPGGDDLRRFTGDPARRSYGGAEHEGRGHGSACDAGTLPDRLREGPRHRRRRAGGGHEEVQSMKHRERGRRAGCPVSSGGKSS